MITAIKHRWYRALYFRQYGNHAEQCDRIMRAWQYGQTEKHADLVEVHRKCGW